MTAALTTSQLAKLALGGWSFFIAENVVLSHNRTWIIQEICGGEESLYSTLYGTTSTVAMGLVAYGYSKVRNAPPLFTKIGRTRHAAAFLFQVAGLIGISQLAPKFQIPVEYGKNVIDDSATKQHAANMENQAAEIQRQPTAAANTTSNFQIRCPFDFKTVDHDGIYGIGRVSRHSTLWSFASFGLGAAMVTASIPQAACLGMPVMVALVGGAHQDYRYRRGIGGTLTPEMDNRTSNIPFLGLLSGNQDKGEGGASGVMVSIEKLGSEIKGLNAGAGVAAALVFALRRL